MGNNIENRIKNVMSAVFDISAQDINNNSSADTIDSWDSLKHMNLIIALEEEFDITIPDTSVGEMVTYELVLQIVNKAT